MNLCPSHVLVSKPLLKIQGANLKLENLRFIADISPGIFRAIDHSIVPGKIYFGYSLVCTVYFHAVGFTHILAPSPSSPAHPSLVSASETDELKLGSIEFFFLLPFLKASRILFMEKTTEAS